MPTVISTLIDGYASCKDGRCPGYKQQPIKVAATETQFSYFDLGGDIPGIERTVTHLHFADPQDEPCPVCGEPRLCSDQVRPVYPNISGVPQDALLQVNRDSERVREMELANLKRDAEAAQMQALIERQNAVLERQERQIAALTDDLATRPRGPGRPRKPPEE